MHPACSLLKSVVQKNLEGFVWCSDGLIALPAARVHLVGRQLRVLHGVLRCRPGRAVRSHRGGPEVPAHRALPAVQVDLWCGYNNMYIIPYFQIKDMLLRVRSQRVIASAKANSLTNGLSVNSM